MGLVKFLPEIMTGLLVALIAGKLAFVWHHLTVLEDQKHEQAAISAQIEADQQQCLMGKQLTENASNEYQKQISTLNGQLNDIRMHRPRTCVVPLPSALSAGRFNAAAPALDEPLSLTASQAKPSYPMKEIAKATPSN